ncbi:MAG: S-layer homology domain-containing protein, partial [Firmicutes bacterium]|nr:S-layer homology domain-containing protein [Bacillota bacterium]
KPQREVQRLVPTALGFFSVAPRGDLAGLVIKGPDVILPGDTAPFILNGYDTHYNPLPVDQGKVKWSLVSGPGLLEKNVFTPSGGGSSVVSASFGGLKSTKSVRVLGAEDFSKLTVEPSAIAVKPGESVDIKVNAVGKDNKVYTLSAKNYSVTADPKLGLFKDGSFKASGSAPAGEIKINFSGLSTTVPVTVASGDQSVYRYTPGQAGVLTLGGLSLRFTGKALSDPAIITASCGGELSGPIPSRFKPVSTARIQASNVQTAGLADPVTIMWKYQPEEGGRAAVIQLIGGTWQELPSRIDEEENRVICRTWELGPVALVRDEQSPARFSDTSGHWAAEAISRLSAEGIVSGYPENTFAPARQITRAEFIVLLCKALGWQPVQGDPGFRDKGVIPAWAVGYVMAAANKGALSGYEDQTFRPSNPVTRSEIAAMTGKALSLPPAEKIQVEKVFADGKAIDPWAVSPVSGVFTAGIMKGDNENKFRARDRATRAEGAVLIDNILNYLFKH